ncbi:MAG: Light-independent protochlorophyllide reductase iron-sulfur ATP-binding protein [candidate division WS2 bacterium]|uniref:Light-independent protochlorophyllide reductase iron-sulfur ATP-binding protein n=1 Tax=Psychracetigena formicireducens TaxID=2986056 RepID=A0A9E2BID3_PSYF1|nr:Light-independent protochlorophyllide reductase iron-sulfur ATP-binding protein [Candidatus Psychracetigena formicireducens]MBT9145417.1 Light-independent protochlorophyllide reductase iron-sulfur ATP-binding protein [Candidatus Psychracetigena formicireducens]MBT9150597.1 Light-independent protochlorophyllide reductase iron-sulfur ATP-binding protein [Candidatus Psychracetigena formicireducens]
MKIAISGKGGVGKSTLAGLLALAFVEAGNKVLAIDADPDANLGSTLGFTRKEINSIAPLSEMKEFIAERTGIKGPSLGQMFKLNPQVDDIPARFSLKKGNLNLLLLGTFEKGGGGCFCPENSLLRSLISHVLHLKDEVVIVDMEAGLEHLGRGTASFVDAFVIVVEPSHNSLQTAFKIKELASDIGVNEAFLVANKIKGDSDLEFIKRNTPGLALLGTITYSLELIEGDLRGDSPRVSSPTTYNQVKTIKEQLEKLIPERHPGNK